MHHPEAGRNRPKFQDLTPVYPEPRFNLEVKTSDVSMRIVDLLCPVGKGQRGLIVSAPKAGKTTLLKEIAQSLMANYADSQLMVLLIDERPEEVTDIQRSVDGDVIASTFDQKPENHMRLASLALERAKRLVEHGEDVVLLLDSLTRYARASNLVVPPSGRTQTGGFDPAALYEPKHFFGAARNVEHGGSLTIVATILVDTGSRRDDYIFEEFKATGNMELRLDRSLPSGASSRPSTCSSRARASRSAAGSRRNSKATLPPPSARRAGSRGSGAALHRPHPQHRIEQGVCSNW